MGEVHQAASSEAIPFVRGRRHLAGLIAAIALAAIACSTAAFAQPKFPQLTGRIVDNAGLLKPDDRTEIESELRALEDKSTDQVAILTVPSLDGYPIEDYGYQLGRTWGIGQAGKDNGVILIVVPSERKVRIEVGRGLEPQLTDTMSKLIIENAILPAFRRGDFSGGIRAGVRDIKDVLLGDAEAVKDRAKGGKPRSDTGPDVVALILFAFWLGIVLFVIYAQIRHARQSPQRVGQRRRRSYGDAPIIVVPGGSSDWGGGWSGGDGGGWSGGGGSFGGGGASGGW